MDADTDIKQVPRDAPTRELIRRAARQVAAEHPQQPRFTRDELEALGTRVLDDLDLPSNYLGFTMVSLSNERWRASFAATPLDRRLLLLPHCLRDERSCPAAYDSVGLHCEACGRCDVADLQQRAERAGYKVVVAEGTGAALMKILDGEADAILGVACLDSLEKSYQRISELGVPHMAVPLLSNGCVRTNADIPEILDCLAARGAASGASAPSHLPLLRFCTKLLSPDSLREALGSFVAGTEMDRIAVDWLSAGGNRLRPFVTLGAYAAVAHGRHSFATEEEAAEAMPEPVCKIGLAIEAFHKASLAHDDIEDDDAYRYGSETLHRRYGIGPALNVGDHLIGLGYGLIAAQREHFGADAVADMVARISSAHLQLCRGQGAELLSDPSRVTPSEVLENYALKTSPAFFAALYCGLRAARADVDEAALRAFCTYLGEGYQIQNDLDDWEQNGANKVERGTDAAAGRPTILRALAGGAVGDDVRKVYEQVGAFEKAEALLARVRERAIDAAGSVMPIPLAEFLASLTRMVLRQRIR